MRSSCVLALALVACGTTTDTRPETAAYITDAILEPDCGRASCHSSGTASHGWVFDTFANAKQSLEGLVVPGHSEGSQLFTILTDTRKIMPPDSPLPDVDVELIRRWIDDGAEGL